MSHWLNTHTYDGTIDVSLLPTLNEIKSLSLEEKRARANELLATITSNDVSTPVGIQSLQIIISAMGTPANYDISNNLSADDLIAIAWCYRNDTEFIKLLNEQLVDIVSGPCPQGRTHRLFQVLYGYPQL